MEGVGRAWDALRFYHVAILWYSVKVMKRSLLLFIILLVLTSCRPDESPPQQQAGGTAVVQPAAEVPVKKGCGGCHGTVLLDPAHQQLACVSCHGGEDDESRIDKAHAGLVARPSHPSHAAATCGSCHPRQVADAAQATHYTLANKINQIRHHFGARDTLRAPGEIPVTTPPATPIALVDDLLRRRCLRCHVYTSGDDYPAVTHGTGCAACHLAFDNGKMKSHAFATPTDKQCLSCHYGNYVGSDYYGRYEHDYNWEYRTPYFSTTEHNTAPRPYGVESHDLSPDLHRQRGLVCIDCHPRNGHHIKKTIDCRSCHGWQPGQPLPPTGNVQVEDAVLVLNGRGDGRKHRVPALRHSAHRQYGQQVACQVCHGQWGFNDAPIHLLLSYHEEYEPWERLTVQASSEVESLLNHNLYYSDEEPLVMRDGLNGEVRPGVWYQGYGQRRWEQILVARDSDGVIKVFRPLLDLRLSMVQADGRASFDNLGGQSSGLLPYTPHTTGHAGLFYLDRFRHLLPHESK